MPDYHVYKGNYLSIVNGSFDRIIEPYYIFISKAFSFLGETGFYFVLFFHIWITLRVLKKVFFLNKAHLPYSLILYLSNFYILFGMIQIRASIALSLFYYAIIFYQNKPYRYIITILLACLFHYSALIFFPIYFLIKIKPNKYIILSLITLGFVVNNLVFDFLSFFIDLLPISDVQNKLLTYSLESRAEQFAINLMGPYIISKLLLGLLVLTLMNKGMLINQLKRTFIMLYFTGIIIYIYLSPFPELAVRLSNYMFFSEIFIIPMFIDVFKEKKLVKTSILAFAVLTLIINISYTSYFHYDLPVKESSFQSRTF